MDNRKLYLDADRFEDFVMCKIEEMQLLDDGNDSLCACAIGGWVSALEWVCDLIDVESEVL